ncbi:AraC family transcriptional regulator [uncultured Lactobacillus sp.]|uniref:AraC family transcriptional regulator n=1 Tax=uncultured Lactobacillus sp. TaxID=153152 RepID=UPI0025D4929F|nr:AraC family transcriptional regulator [uncultured Lactobacillus sp.]
MNRRIYMSYKAIQKYLSFCFFKRHQKISLLDAILHLYQKSNYSYELPKTPNSLNKTHDIFSLYQCLQNLHVDVTAIIQKPQQLYKNMSESYFMFEEKDAKILLQFQNELVHYHKHDYFEIDLVLDGETKFFTDNSVSTLHKGDLVIISPGTSHKIEVIESSIVICIVMKKSTFDNSFFNLIKADNILADFFNKCLYSSTENYLTFNVQITEKILGIIKNIFIESYSSLPQSNAICCDYISILLSYALRGLSESNNFKTYDNNLTNRFAKIINTIKVNCDTVKLKDLARQYNYDKAYLGKLISKKTGHSFNYLRNYYRIQKSCNLLKYTDDSINSISEQVGYSSVNSFERSFQTVLHLTPSAYRRKFIKDSVFYP